MDTHFSLNTGAAVGGADRLRQAWFIAAQLVVLGLLVLALLWTSQPPNPNHPVPELQRPDLQDWARVAHLYRLPLAVFAIASLIAGLVPALRRHALTSALSGVTLGTACWLSSVHLWQLPAFNDAYATIPAITPIVAAATVLLFITGLLARVGIIRGAAVLGNGALAGLLLLTTTAGICYVAINYLPLLRPLGYEIGRDQLFEMLASFLLFLPALWLGGIAIRREARWCFQPIGAFLVLTVFLVMWRGR